MASKIRSERPDAELRAFVEKYNLMSAAQEEALWLTMKPFLRKHMALLTWHAELRESDLWRTEPNKRDDFRLYLRESASDFAQALLLACQGLYKPAYLITRSAVENFVRCMGIYADQKVLALSGVFQLFDVVGEIAVVRSSKLGRILFGQLRSSYSALCAHVHTSSSSHMALTEVVGGYPRFIAGDSAALFRMLNDATSVIIAFLVIMFPREYAHMHHTRSDIVSDAMTTSLKRDLGKMRA